MATSRPRVKRDAVRLWGAPQPEVFIESAPGAALAQASTIHFDKKKDRDRLLALEKLALDIFNDPLAARAFAVNPDEYMRRGGFPNVGVDLNSQEVKIAMALGDPAVREAARRGDVDSFLDAMIAQGIKPSIGSPLALFGVELAVWFTAVAVSWVAAAYSVETAVSLHHKIGVIGVKPTTVEHHVDALTRIAKRLGGPDFVKKVQSARMKQIVERYVALHKAAIKTVAEA